VVYSIHLGRLTSALLMTIGHAYKEWARNIKVDSVAFQ